MSQEEDAETPFAVEPLVEGVSIVLPGRNLPKGGLIAGCLIPFGFVFAAVPLMGFLGSGSLVPGLMAIVFGLIGLAVILIALAVPFGHGEVLVEHGVLQARERLGPLQWTRRRALDGLARLRVKEGQVVVNGRPVKGIGNLVAEFENGKPFLVALLYRNELLQALGAELGPHVGIDLGEEPVEVVDSDDPESETSGPEDLVQPPTSSATLDYNAVGLLLTLPPAGLMRGSRGLVVFAVIWCGMLAVMTGLMLVTADLTPGMLMIIPFWLVGIALALAAINMGRRHAIVGVVRGDLLIKRINLFGTRTHELPGPTIKSIRAGPSSMSVNDRPILHLAIHAGDETLGLWAGRDEAELRWIAAVLRDGLKLDRT